MQNATAAVAHSSLVIPDLIRDLIQTASLRIGVRNDGEMELLLPAHPPRNPGLDPGSAMNRGLRIGVRSDGFTKASAQTCTAVRQERAVV